MVSVWGRKPLDSFESGSVMILSTLKKKKSAGSSDIMTTADKLGDYGSCPDKGAWWDSIMVYWWEVDIFRKKSESEANRTLMHWILAVRERQERGWLGGWKEESRKTYRKAPNPQLNITKVLSSSIISLLIIFQPTNYRSSPK